MAENSNSELLCQALSTNSVNSTIEDDIAFDIPPATGQEYLRRVKQEATKCPDIVVADLNMELFRKQQTVIVSSSSGCLTPPEGYTPGLSWQTQQTSDFSDVRQKLLRCKARLKNGQMNIAKPKVPQSENAEGWCRMCFGSYKVGKPQPLDENSPDKIATGNSTLPLLSILVHMDQPTIVKVLGYHINWFEATGFGVDQGRWFYALLSCLEKPLCPETCSLLRSLARSCANLRASLENADDDKLIPLNLIICLVGRYFDQTDVADNG